MTELRRRVAYGRFDVGFWQLMLEPIAHELREAIIARYFPDDREKIAAVVAANGPTAAKPDELQEEMPPYAAFRRTILGIYDYRCAACGVRVLLDQTVSLVEAAHLIPFEAQPKRQADERDGAVRITIGQWTAI